jgi:DMSO/TMAO reductase YedYZ molybdopterin-dependent catalytic subunit
MDIDEIAKRIILLRDPIWIFSIQFGALGGGIDMDERFILRGFIGKRREKVEDALRIPPGQYVTRDFPVLSAGPTPHTPIEKWNFTIEWLVKEPITWSWEEFTRLPSRTFIADIHCVTKWSKLNTHWEGVSVDTLLEHVDLDPRARYALVFSDGDYSTNLPLTDVLNGQAFVAYRFEGRPLAPEHGGPARLVVPHLYFWKSAKWVRGLRLTDQDKPGFWESLGYHDRGDPWKEQRYWGD